MRAQVRKRSKALHKLWRRVAAHGGSTPWDPGAAPTGSMAERLRECKKKASLDRLREVFHSSLPAARSLRPWGDIAPQLWEEHHNATSGEVFEGLPLEEILPWTSLTAHQGHHVAAKGHKGSLIPVRHVTRLFLCRWRCFQCKDPECVRSKQNMLTPTRADAQLQFLRKHSLPQVAVQKRKMPLHTLRFANSLWRATSDQGSVVGACGFVLSYALSHTTELAKPAVSSTGLRLLMSFQPTHRMCVRMVVQFNKFHRSLCVTAFRASSVSVQDFGKVTPNIALPDYARMRQEEAHVSSPPPRKDGWHIYPGEEKMRARKVGNKPSSLSWNDTSVIVEMMRVCLQFCKTIH